MSMEVTMSSELISKLQIIQNEFQYLPEEKLYELSMETGIPTGQIMGVATFYEGFRFKPAGKHRIKVCVGTACHVKGAESIYKSYREFLKIEDDNDTDKNMMFTVEKVACLGCCSLAPAVQIDSVIYGPVNKEIIPNTISDFLQSITPGSIGTNDKSHFTIDGEVRTCLCSSCVASGGLEIYNQLKYMGITTKVVSCRGLSYNAPQLEIIDNCNNSFIYKDVKRESVIEILLKHFKSTLSFKIRHYGDKIIDFIAGTDNPKSIALYNSNEFCKCQKKLVTESAGITGPLNLEDYKEHSGFSILESEITPDEVINVLYESGLRGRGGAGFPTYLKWKKVKENRGEKKFLICNGDEGDPGAFMDRMILESFPFKVIEGILIACKTCSIHEALLYIREEYPLAIKRVQEAIGLCKYLFEEHSVDLRVIVGAGAFICGEETALIESIEGKRGEPREKGPYPSEMGLYGYPTLVNNVETFAAIPWIIRNGSEEFSNHGTERSPGTKLFALAGKINRGGLIEVPMGITIREIVENIGGGVENDRPLKAVQIGGPSGGCVPESLCDTPIDYEELQQTGSIMGSGGLVILDDRDCMVEFARYFMEFTYKESCGRCTYCRVGTKRMLEILTNLCENRGRVGDIERLIHLGQITTQRSKCGLGKNASAPLLSTIRYFRDEYQSHIDGCCPAASCKNLITFSINDNCIGCTKCFQICPAEAIEFLPYQKHSIDNEKCIRCGECKNSCLEGAIDVN